MARSLTQLRRDHNAFIAKARRLGARIVALDCPHCQKQIETLAPGLDEVWDSMCTCPHCEGLFMKVVHHDRAYGRT